MSAKKFILASMLTVLTFPAITYAQTLGFQNATGLPLTVAINNKCSSEFGTLPRWGKSVSEDTLSKLCAPNTSNCVAKIFKSNNCAGQQILEAVFDVFDPLRRFKKIDNLPEYDVFIIEPMHEIYITNKRRTADSHQK